MFFTDCTEESFIEWGNLKRLKSLKLVIADEESPSVRNILKSLVVGQVPLQSLVLIIRGIDAAMLEYVSQMNKMEKLDIGGLPDGYWTNDQMKRLVRNLTHLSEIVFLDSMDTNSVKSTIRQFAPLTSACMMFATSSSSQFRKKDHVEIVQLMKAYPRPKIMVAVGYHLIDVSYSHCTLSIDLRN